MLIGFCGACMSWAMNKSGIQWHCAAERWCCDFCYARENGLALWFWQS